MCDWKRLAVFSGLLALCGFMAGCHSQNQVLPLVEVVEMPEEEIEEALDGVTSEEIEKAWGAPVAELSGMDGAVFDLGGDSGKLTVYYGNDERSVVAVKKLVEDEKGQAGEADLERLVAQAVLDKNWGRYTGEECVGEGHVILKTEETGRKLTVYALTMYGEYQFQDGNFVKEAGSGAVPAVITFLKDSQGAYQLDAFAWPEDGGGYVESIRKLFPKELWKLCLSPTEECQSRLKEMECSYAKAYLKEIGREARIGEYGDFEHPLLTDVGVSVEASNRIGENKDLWAYPYWIGNVERLETGGRYVYAMDVDARSKKIVFTKTVYGKGDVAERHEFDWETGQPIGARTAGQGTAFTEDAVLKEPPALLLHDALSSAWNEYELKPEAASWNYKQGGSMVGVVSCGTHPLAAAKEKEHLKTPRYNRIEFVPYLVSCPVNPDRITVEEYDIEGFDGLEDAQAASVWSYEGEQLIELKPGKGYVITAQWDKGHLDTYGFYGTGCYCVVTE